MCGIAGLLQFDGTDLPLDAREWLARMTGVMAHRGPDAEGFWQDGPIALGHRRLSIIDLSTGSQPMSAAEGRFTISYNGEIYNFKEVRADLEQLGHNFRTSSDTEVILAAYESYGVSCLDRLEGMFAFALWDKREKTLFCARDRFGKKPFLYTAQNGRFAFASEMTAFKNLPDFSFTVNRAAVARYLAYEYVPTPDSIYTEVRKLPPSHYLLARDGQIKIERYWSLPAPEETSRSEDDLAAELRERLALAVQRRLVSDVPLGVFLSGGIDSSIVTGLMASMSSKVKTFSIGFTEDSYDESAYARLVAGRWSTEHHERILSADECAEILPAVASKLDEPMADASVAPTWLLAGLTREKVTVALGGDGADELYAGYEHYIAFKTAEWYMSLPTALREKILEPLVRFFPASAGYVNLRLAAQTFLKGAHAPNWQRVQTLLTALTPEMQRELWLESDESILAPENLFASTREHYEFWPSAKPLERAFHVYVRQFLLDDILYKVDRCTMMHSLEARAPFLDRDFAEFSAKLPVEMKLHGFSRKYLLKKACADLLPKEILNRNKRGFQIPVAAWLRTSLRPLMEDLLSEEFLRKQGLFNPVYVRRLMDEHFEGKADHRKPLWTLLVLQLWWRR